MKDSQSRVQNGGSLKSAALFGRTPQTCLRPALKSVIDVTDGVTAESYFLRFNLRCLLFRAAAANHRGVSTVQHYNSTR